MKPNEKDDLEKDKLNSLSDFLVVSPLGRGAGSLVYKIKSRKSGNEYALKSIHKDKSNPSYKSIQQRLKSEIEIHQSLKNEHIVKLINYFDDSDNNYILLEYCESGDLFGYVQNKKKISEQEVKCLGLEFAQGLKYLHDNKIIHRDLKLGNILLTKDHKLKICDFGLSIKITNNNQEITTLCGTPNYISPLTLILQYSFLNREMIKHLPYNQKIDIWAFGCIIHHMAAGFNPFEGLNPQQVLAKINDKNFQIKTNVSSSLDDLLTKIFQENPEKRYSIQEVLDHPFFSGGTLAKPISQQQQFLHKRHQSSSQLLTFKNNNKNSIALQSILENNKENYQNLLKFQSISTARNYSKTNQNELKKSLISTKPQCLTQRNIKPRNSVLLNHNSKNLPEASETSNKQIITKELLKRSQSIENLYTRRTSKNLTQQIKPIIQQNILQEKQKNIQQQENIQNNVKNNTKNLDLMNKKGMLNSPQKVKENQQFTTETETDSQSTAQQTLSQIQMSPLHTENLQKQTIQLKQRQIIISEDQTIQFQFKENQSMNISADGLIILVKHELNPQLNQLYNLSDLPDKYAQLYSYVKQVCVLLRNKQVKKFIQNDHGSFKLIEKNGAMHFEGNFKSQHKVQYLVNSNMIQIVTKYGSIFNINLRTDLKNISQEFNNLVTLSFNVLNQLFSNQQQQQQQQQQ